MVVEQIIDSAATVYPVNPMCARRYRERKHSSGTKTDRHDAWALADALRTDGHAWRALGPKDPIIEELRILCRDEVALIEERTALINQMRQALREPSASETDSTAKRVLAVRPEAKPESILPHCA
jgi:transposase